MNIALISAFLVALAGFGLTFYGLRSIHLRETTNKPVIFFTIGIILIVLGAFFFFIESLYRGLATPASNYSRQQVVVSITPTQMPAQQTNPISSVTGMNGYPSQLVQQFMTTCQATVGRQKQQACECILSTVEKFYTPDELKSIKSPSQLSPQATAAITSCLR